MLNFIIVAVIVVLGYIAAIYNRLVSGKVKVEEGWSGIAVQLKRRHDLIPNLVSTVKGYATHEKDVFTQVTEARNKSTSVTGVAQTAQAESAVTAGLSRLLAVAENYPELKANTNFLQLQGDLSAIEDSLQSARRYYNGAVRDYQIVQQSFPSNIVANYFSFEKKEYFELEDVKAESTVPSVQF